jgi:hypothetical protein
MTCSACAKRRKALEAKRKEKQAQGKQIQATALGAVLAVSQTVGKAIGQQGEQDERGTGSNSPKGLR